ncbi:MAG TPA: HAD-IIA family hydrolase [Acidimicrobiales bacterium]|nr:HAD-IIA family hydrolase [Acidimicrobiales bacterium]
MTWLLDLDGVVWLSEEPIEGSPEAVAQLRDRGERVAFLTNNSSREVGDVVSMLEGMGIEASPEEVITSALAGAALVEPGEKVLVCAGPGVDEALHERGAETVRDGEADAVMIGWHRDFDFERLTAAVRAVMGGARLLATNEDVTFPSPDGPVPGAGSILAAVSAATGAEATVAGKPHEPVAELIKERFGDIETLVGDRPSTDGLLAKRLGSRFLLALSGVTKEEDLPVEPEPDEVEADLAAHVKSQMEG